MLVGRRTGVSAFQAQGGYSCKYLFVNKYRACRAVSEPHLAPTPSLLGLTYHLIAEKSDSSSFSPHLWRKLNLDGLNNYGIEVQNMKPHWIKFRNIMVVLLVFFGLAGIVTAKKTYFNATGDHEGLFLLKGENGSWFELTDDLFPEEAHRLIYGSPLTWFKHVVQTQKCNASASSCINFEWNESTGRGFIQNAFPDGTKLLMCLSRFDIPQGSGTKGLFLGGGLSPDNPDYRIDDVNEAGMAYFDGKRYYHIWCNVNEALVSARDTKALSYPSQWEFLGSKVLENNGKDVTLSSRHRTVIDGIPFDIDKFLSYEAGDTYFTLVTKVTNRGSFPGRFFYIYGDEPFLGNYGSSQGNVGWLKGGIVNMESYFDTKRNTFAGMFDYGNALIGERHEDYTGKANFIEWDVKSRPDYGYFANKEGGTGFLPNTPLANPDNRFIGLEWGPRLLKPGESFLVTLAIGMAGNNPGTGFPVKPVTPLN
jgi:hypothetical protein